MNDLFSRLEIEAEARCRNHEPAHDFLHVKRVLVNARFIARAEGEDELACGAAALLHELFTYPKGHPESSRAGDVCAEHARALLIREGAPSELVEPVCVAIRDHAFSKGVVPKEAPTRILQDADRLDAIGAIGLARMWATCADMKRPFYSPIDAFCTHRAPDDKSWGLDHVFKKLLVIPERFHTKAARTMGERRVRFLRTYLDELASELEMPQ
jgi:uncharacterized protein